MPLHARDAAALQTLTADCRRLFATRLEALALYGEAATDTYRPLVSPLETVLLLDRVGVADLRVLGGQMKRWHRARLSIPLVVDRAYLASSRDVFPLELLELHDRHRLLHGAEDPFAALAPPSPSHLRLELEEQLKGKLLHLREGYLAHGGTRRGLDVLLRAARASVDLILRGVLALAERPRPIHAAHVLGAVTDLHGMALDGLARLERWCAGEERLGDAALEALYAAVHDDVAALVARLDRP